MEVDGRNERWRDGGMDEGKEYVCVRKEEMLVRMAKFHTDLWNRRLDDKVVFFK